MANPDENLFAPLSAETSRLVEQIRTMGRTRYELAALETREVGRQVRRVSVGLALGAWLIASSLPLLVVALAGWCSQWLGISPAACQTAGFVILVSTGALIAVTSWRKFRRDFVGWEESLAELQEDLIWLREWTTADDASAPQPPGNSDEESAEMSDSL